MKFTLSGQSAAGVGSQEKLEKATADRETAAGPSPFHPDADPLPALSESRVVSTKATRKSDAITNVHADLIGSVAGDFVHLVEAAACAFG
jgi:hypothetical protein